MKKKYLTIFVILVAIMLMGNEKPEPTPTPPPPEPPPPPPQEADKETQRLINALFESINQTGFYSLANSYARCTTFNEVKNLKDKDLIKVAVFYKKQFDKSLYKSLLNVSSGCIANSPILIIRTRLKKLNQS